MASPLLFRDKVPDSVCSHFLRRGAEAKFTSRVCLEDSIWVEFFLRGSIKSHLGGVPVLASSFPNPERLTPRFKFLMVNILNGKAVSALFLAACLSF